MRSTSRAARQPSRPAVRCTTARRRQHDVLGVCETLTEAQHAASMLAARGIATAGISVIMPPLARGRRATSRDGEIMVLLHGRQHDTERAHEILADAAARASNTVEPFA